MNILSSQNEASALRHLPWQKTIRKTFVTQVLSLKNDSVSQIITVWMYPDADTYYSRKDSLSVYEYRGDGNIICHIHCFYWLCVSHPTDDGPYSKGNKDSTGADNTLTSRRQSIPGTPDYLSIPSICAHTKSPTLGWSSLAPLPQRLLILGTVSVSFSIGNVWVLLATLVSMAVWDAEDWGLRVLLQLYPDVSCSSLDVFVWVILLL